MNRAGIYHHCGDTWCYALDERTLHIRIRTAADDADLVEIVSGDPFERMYNGTKHVWDSSISPMTKAGSNGVHDFWEIKISPPYLRLKYWFIIHKGTKTWEFGEKGIVDTVDRNNTWNTFVFPYLHTKEVFHAPEWVRKTVWYQIFPDRFFNGNPELNPAGTELWQYGPVTNSVFYGGNLPGITAKLDHIAGLGFNGIYLTPIFESPSVHKYDTTDYMKIDPAFGTLDDLKTLVSECHRRGIKIILDAVFNHSGTGFTPWRDVLEKGENSHFKDWFAIDKFPLFPNKTDPGEHQGHGDSHQVNFHTFAFTTGMPKLNTANPVTREYLLGVAEYYIKECDIDGWRLDVANEIDHEFWQLFRKRVKAAKPEAYIVGEIWHNSMEWLHGDQYDAVMNYHFGQAICDFLLASDEIRDGKDLAHRMTTLELSYPLTVIRAGFNLLDSHDTERLIHRLGEDVTLARLAWLVLSLLPGSPCFYYGSEYALTGAHDPDCRRCMPWEPEYQDMSQYAFFKEIISLRTSNAELINRGERTWLFTNKVRSLFGMRISLGEKRLTILINRGREILPRKKYAHILDAREKKDSGFGDIPPQGFLYR
jgi:glycosidase